VSLMYVRPGQSKMPGLERWIYRGVTSRRGWYWDFESALIMSDLLPERPGCVSVENLSNSLVLD